MRDDDDDDCNFLITHTPSAYVCVCVFGELAGECCYSQMPRVMDVGGQGDQNRSCGRAGENASDYDYDYLFLCQQC